MVEEKSRGVKLRTWVIWLVAALLIETGVLLVFTAHNRSLRAELTEARRVVAPVRSGNPSATTDTASGSFIFRLAEPALPTNTPPAAMQSGTPQQSVVSSAFTKIPDGIGARAWKFIVVHHSATTGGSAQAFETYHRARGMNNGLAYHFVVCNGTNDTDDGEVEIGSRWLKQLAGGHCKQETVNDQSIGICLVGDFTQRRPSDKQMETLAQLVFDLQKRFNIPLENVLGHGHVVGEFSECPGKSFPWETFRAALAKVVESDRAEKQVAFSIKPIVPPVRP